MVNICDTAENVCINPSKINTYSKNNIWTKFDVCV